MPNEVRKAVDGIVGWLARQGVLGDEEIKELYAQGERFQRIVSGGFQRAQKLSERAMAAMTASFPSVDLKKETIEEHGSMKTTFKREEMLEYQFFPFNVVSGTIYIAVTDESGFLFLVNRANGLGMTFRYFSAPLKEIIAAIKKHYPSA